MLYHSASQKQFSTTVTYPDYPAFFSRAHILERTDQSLLGEVWSIWRVLREWTRNQALLLDSTSGRIHPDLIAAILMGFLPKKQRPVVVFMGAMWQRDSGLKGLIEKMLIRLADRSITRYALQATDELPYFSSTWGIPDSKLRFVPYFYTFTESDLAGPAPSTEVFIFSGGNSHRDYKTLLEAARALPEHTFVIAARVLEGQSLPPNVKAAQVSRQEFIFLMRASAAVVVPIRPNLNRTAGQQTYLNSMLLGKPTIINNVLGVRDYVQNNDIAWVVDGSVEGYIGSIREIFDPAHQEKVREVTAKARRKVLEQFTFERHAERLLAILDEAIEEARVQSSRT